MPPPEILWKYRSLEGDSRIHTLRAISHREIWFSSLREFNDPFEARVAVSIDGDDQAWQREFGCLRPDQALLTELVQKLEEGVRTDAEQLGIFSLSNRFDDILMWSHYSGSHRGVCFGFRTTGDSILYDARPIEYSDTYPEVNYFAMTAEQRAQKMLLTKASHWAYEEEWRVLRTGPTPGIEVYPPGMLVRDARFAPTTGTKS